LIITKIKRNPSRITTNLDGLSKRPMTGTLVYGKRSGTVGAKIVNVSL